MTQSLVIYLFQLHQRSQLFCEYPHVLRYGILPAGSQYAELHQVTLRNHLRHALWHFTLVHLEDLRHGDLHSPLAKHIAASNVLEVQLAAQFGQKLHHGVAGGDVDAAAYDRGPRLVAQFGLADVSQLPRHVRVVRVQCTSHSQQQRLFLWRAPEKIKQVVAVRRANRL